MKRRRAVAVWRIAGQLEEDLRQEKVTFDHFEQLRRLLRHAGRKGSCMNLRGVVLRPVQGGKRSHDLTLDLAPHLGWGRLHLFNGKCEAGHWRIPFRSA